MTLTASVVISSYNYAEYVAAAIQSALEQEPPVEVVVVDDGSSDNSLGIARSFGSAVNVVAQNNAGQAAALNQGVANSTGEIVLFCDSDDLLMPERLQRVRGAFESSPGIGWVLHPLLPVDRKSMREIPDTRRIVGRRPSGPWDVREYARTGRRLAIPAGATSGIALRRQTLELIHPIPDALRVHVDEYLRQAALALTPGYLIAEPLSMMGIHGRNEFNGRLRDSKRQLERDFASLHTAAALLPLDVTLAAFCDRLAMPALRDARRGRYLRDVDRDVASAYRAQRPTRALARAFAMELLGQLQDWRPFRRH